MKLQENEFFSIEFFNENGLEKVAELIELDYEELEYEFEIGNYLIAQDSNQRYFFFCETDETDKEITFNEFKRRCHAELVSASHKN